MTAPAPSVCQTCDGDGYVERWGDWTSPYDVILSFPCPDCHCAVCGRHTAAIAGECGQCWDQAERYFERVSDR